MTVTAKTPI